MEISPDVLSELRAESAELVERFSRTWMLMNARLDSEQSVERSEIDELFRILHSLKGLSEIIELRRVASALHALEDRLSEVRLGQSEIGRRDLETLAERQLLLEKIFVTASHQPDEQLIVELEHHSRRFSSPDDGDRVSGSANDREACLALTEDERALWDVFCGRNESFYAFVSDSALSELRERIVSIGEILLERTCGHKNLFVFAAELDQELVEQIVEAKVQCVAKEISALSSLGQPWLDVLGLSTPSTESSLSEAETAIKETAVEAHRESVKFEHSPSSIDATEASDNSPVSEFDREMALDFLNNGEELLESITQSMLQLEGDPNNTSSVEEIFRAAHTIKGTAGMLGLSCIEQLCHALENTFDRIRKKRVVATPALVDTLLSGWDYVRNLFTLLRAGKTPQLPLEDFLSRLHAAESGEIPVAANQTQTAKIGQSTAQGNENNTVTATKSEGQGTIRVDLKRLDSLVNLVGELVIDRTRFARIEEAMRLRGASADLSHQMAESLLLFGRHMNEVQNIIMKVRMVPIGNAFYKFSRVVRDLSRQCNKEVELVIQGGDTELDKTLVEDIGDPLVHLIRNSVDHGIEAPEQRLKAGKPAKGKIQLSAAQQGNSIVITIEDDGQGLDVDKIRAKAIKSGLLKESDHPPIKDVFNLIFEPGFSTADKVTNISGRGVGMDVVKKNIQKLKGIVELDSVRGQGTKITIKLPITLAIVPSLLVEVSGECFAVPLVNVIESIRISSEDVQHMGKSKFVKLREQVVPLVKFSDVLGLSEMDSQFWYRTHSTSPALQRRPDRLIFVVVGIGHERLGLVVDRLLGQQEIVIKPLGHVLGPQLGFAGGCVLGDGRVALVIDVAEVVGSDNSQRGGHARRIA